MPLEIDNVIVSQPWLIKPEWYEQIRAIAARNGDLEALQVKAGRELEGTQTMTVRNGVATVPITGPVFRYANLFTQISGATSTQTLATDIAAAIEDPSVRAVLLNVDSPGGAAAGISELADSIRAWSSKKPIYAYVSDCGASAAYWLAAAATKVYAADSALVGSIGVVMGYLDTTKRDEKSDVKRVELVSSVSPDKRLDPSTDAGRAKVQKLVDGLGNLFVSKVAAFRGVEASAVLEKFGRGGMLIAGEAAALGMIDGVSSFEGVHAMLVETVKRNYFGVTSTMSQKLVVNSQAALIAAAAAVAAGGATADQLQYESLTASQDQLDAAVAGERERVATILSFAQEGFEKEISAYIADGTTAANAAVGILKAQKDRGTTLAQQRADGPAVTFAKPAQPKDPKAEAAGTWNFAVEKTKTK